MKYIIIVFIVMTFCNDGYSQERMDTMTCTIYIPDNTQRIRMSFLYPDQIFTTFSAYCYGNQFSDTAIEFDDSLLLLFKDSMSNNNRYILFSRKYKRKIIRYHANANKSVKKASREFNGYHFYVFDVCFTYAELTYWEKNSSVIWPINNDQLLTNKSGILISPIRIIWFKPKNTE